MFEGLYCISRRILLRFGELVSYVNPSCLKQHKFHLCRHFPGSSGCGLLTLMMVSVEGVLTPLMSILQVFFSINQPLTFHCLTLSLYRIVGCIFCYSFSRRLYFTKFYFLFFFSLHGRVCINTTI